MTGSDTSQPDSGTASLASPTGATDGAAHADPAATGDPPPSVRAERAQNRNEALGNASARLATYSLRLLLISAALVVVALVLGAMWPIVLPLILGLLLTTVLWPPVHLLRARGLPPALAAVLVLLLGMLLLAGGIAYLAPEVTGQAQPLADNIVEGLSDLQGRVEGPPFNLGQDQVGGAVDAVVNELQANAQDIAGRVVSGVGAAGGLLVNALLALVLTFFFLKDGPKFLPWLAALLGPTAAPHVQAVASRSWRVLGGFIRAQAAVGLVDAVFIGIGLALLGVPLALPLAVLIFFGAFIPIIGAVVTGALAALVALVTQGPTDALIVVGLVLLVQQLEGNVLQPILVGRTLDLHPALVILAVTAGGSLAGIAGAFLAVPVVSVLAVIVRYVRETLGDPRPAPVADPT